MEEQTEKQIYADQIARSLSRAGIGKLYHKRSLAEFGEQGATVLAAQDKPKEFKEFLMAGKGYRVSPKQEKDSSRAYDFSILLAKSFHLMQFSTRVMPLPAIADFIQNGFMPGDDSRFENLATVQCIIIPRFYEPMDALPLSRNELYRIEEFLTSKMENGYSVSVQYSGVLNKTGWWSNYFAQRIEESCVGITI